MPNSEASSKITESPENLTAETVYEDLNSFFKGFEITPEKLEISYPEGKNAKGVFEEISSLIEEGKKEVANTGEKPEDSPSPSEKIKAKIAEIQDYRVEAFANCALKVFESNGNDQNSKNKVLEKLTSAFSFLGKEEGKEEGKETNKEDKKNKEIDQFTGALKAINADQEIEVGLKQNLVGSFRDAFMKKKEPEPNKENSTEPENSSPETSNSQDDEKAKTKDNPEKHFLDNYNVNYQSAGAAAAKLSIAIALCFVAPPIGFLLSAGFCAATPSWGKDAITEKKDHEIGSVFLGKEATEKQEKEQEPEAIKKALSSAIEEVVKGKESAAEPNLEPGTVENTNKPAALATTQAAATTIENTAANPTIESSPTTTEAQPNTNPSKIENLAASTSNGAQEVPPSATEALESTNPTTQLQAATEAATTQPQANTNPAINVAQAEAIDLEGIDLTFVNNDSAKENESRPAEPLLEALPEALLGTTHSEGKKAINGFTEEILAKVNTLADNLITHLSGNKNSGEVSKVANPLLNSEENTNSEIFFGDSKEEPADIGKHFLVPEAGKSEELSSPTPVEDNNNPTKDSKSQFLQNSEVKEETNHNIPSSILEEENKNSSLPKQGSKDDSDLNSPQKTELPKLRSKDDLDLHSTRKAELPKLRSRDDSDLQLKSKVAKIAKDLGGKISSEDSNLSPKAPQTPSPQINNWMTDKGR
jgi:hypothetical protein